MPRIPKSITQPRKMFLKPKGVLKNIFSETRILLDIQSAVKDVIHADVQVASLRDGDLHLVTHSAAIATRIKYSQKSIIGALKINRRNQPIRNIKVSVQPIFDRAEQKLQPALAPSPENARQLEAAADYVKDPALKQALKKLAARGKTAPNGT